MNFLDTLFRRGDAVEIVGGEHDGGTEAKVAGRAKRGQVLVEFGATENFQEYVAELSTHPDGELMVFDAPEDAEIVVTKFRRVAPQHLRRK